MLSTLTGDFDPLRSYPYRGWEDFYRKIWTWDKVVRSTHSANCTGSCSWKVYVRNGVMVREEQAADYPRISADLPDYNPRGCQKGGCFTEYVYSPQRLRYPLIRTGERGEGKWRRATWDEALTMVAEKLLDNIYNYGPDTNSFFSVIPAMSPVSFCAGSRLAHYIGGVFLSFYDWYCDLPPGEPLTWGVQTEACECADWFNSKYIVLWGSNISQTRIPDAHFAYEARYNGAKIVCISPDYNASATHADLYFRINPGTDGILALGVAKLLIDQNLIDAPYVKEQTDMPLLVLSGTNRFLRESDLKKGGKEDIFYFWDTKQQRAVPTPGSMGSEQKTIQLNGADPALTGTFQVQLADGKTAEVTTVFELLKKEIAGYTVDKVAARTGLPAHEIELFAKELGTRKPAMIIHGAGTNHWFHNDLSNRSLILLVALTGNTGKNGGGFNHYVGQERVWPEQGFFKLAFPETRKKQRFQNTTLWSYVHSTNKDPHLYNGKPIEWYIQESVKNGWMPLWPKNGKKPRRVHRVARELPEPGQRQRDSGIVTLERSRPDRRYQLPHGHHGTLLRRGAARGQLLREGGHQHHRLPQLHSSLRQGLRATVRKQDRLGHLPRAGREDGGSRDQERISSPFTTRLSTGTATSRSWRTTGRARARFKVTSRPSTSSSGTRKKPRA